ncbi:MAG: hypothetical protein J7K73_03110 [Nanoarchaeota archaeon]|nr:hypothetical protein [Nanoarchaeota archaeon]
MRRQRKKKQKKIEKEPVIIKVAPFGIFAFHKGKLVKKELWKEKDAAGNFFKRDEMLKEFKSKIPIRAKQEIETLFGPEIEKFAKKNGIKFNFQKFMIEFTKLKIKAGFSKDKLIIQSINMLEELNKVINILYEKLREWYGTYWPEKVEQVKTIEEFIRIVGMKREGQSMGFDFEEEDLEIVKSFGEELKSLLSLREKISHYIEKIMTETAPNLTKVAGPIIGAKLIAIAGGLDKLAKMPSSTIQVLGAEKALFRHIRRGTKPPKYGVLLSHDLMRKVKQKNRGKLARILASKISIATRVDYYSKGRDIIWKGLIEDINKKLEKLQ